MVLFYQCSDGTVIDFNNEKITVENPESLLENKWKYKNISCVNGLGKVKSFYREATERSFVLNILADDADDFNFIMENLHKHFEKDVRSLQPGRIYWNGYYKECFIFESSPSDYDENFEFVTQNLTVLSVYDFWIKETQHNFMETSSMDESTGIEYPYDFEGFDYLICETVEVLNCNCIFSANFVLRFFGPCINPSVTINGHIYELRDLELDDGEYAEINSKTRKIKKISALGNAENIFHLQNKESYIFELIPLGKLSIVRQKSLQLSITIFDERGEPIWI